MIANRLKRWNLEIGLGVPPSTGLREALQWLMLARLGLLYSVLSIVVLQQVFRREAVHSPTLIWAYSLLAISFAFNCLNAFFVEQVSRYWWLAFVHILFDVMITTAWIHGSGTRESLFALLYLIQILAVSLTLYQRGALVASVLAVVAFGLITLSSPQATGWTGWAVYSLLFITVGMVGGYLSEELLRTNESLQEKNRKIEKLKALHERIISNMPTGLLTVDSQMRINFLNPAGEHILGRHAEEVTGKDLSEIEGGLVPFFSQIEAKEVQDEPSEEGDPSASTTALSSTGPETHKTLFVQARLEKGTARLQQTVEVGRGTRIRILRGDVAELDADAGLGGLLGEQATGGRVLLFQDVTKLIHLEEKLKQHEKLAAVGQLAAGIAHEIRNPLASMSASIEMLKESMPMGGGYTENQKLMEIAIREIDRLNRLVSEFLDFVKPDKFKIENIELKKLLAELVLQVRGSKDFKDKISIREVYQLPDIALANGEKLKQVIWNLLVNAVQAMKKDGVIEVGCGPVGGQRVKFWVEDQGLGMNEEVLVHLYEPFFTTKDKGTGLGLATAYKIIEAHHGEIRVSSTVNVGTRFEVFLPAA